MAATPCRTDALPGADRRHRRHQCPIRDGPRPRMRRLQVFQPVATADFPDIESGDRGFGLRHTPRGRAPPSSTSPGRSSATPSTLTNAHWVIRPLEMIARTGARRRHSAQRFRGAGAGADGAPAGRSRPDRRSRRPRRPARRSCSGRAPASASARWSRRAGCGCRCRAKAGTSRSGRRRPTSFRYGQTSSRSTDAYPPRRCCAGAAWCGSTAPLPDRRAHAAP